MSENIFVDNSYDFDPANAGQVDNSRADDQSVVENLESQDSQQGQPMQQTQEGSEATAPSTEGQAGEENTVPSWQQEYKSPDEMYEELQRVKKSYNHLRPEYTKVTQELSKLRKQHEDNQLDTDPQQAQQGQQTGEVYTDPVTGRPYSFDQYGNPFFVDTQQGADVLSQVQSYLQQAVAPLQQQMAEVQMQNEVAKLATNKPDFKEVAPTMKQILEQTPELWNLGTDRALDIAYNYARASLLEQQMGKAVSDAKEQTYRNKEIKTLVGTDRARPNTQNTQPSVEEQIKQSILGEAGDSPIF